MKEKLQYLALLIVVAITVTAARPPKGAIFHFDDKDGVYNFGTIDNVPRMEHDYRFTNTGDEPIIIQNVMASTGAMCASWPKEPVAPGKSGVIKVTFDSHNRIGPCCKTIAVRSNARMENDEAGNPVILYFKGTIKQMPGEPGDTLRVKGSGGGQ